MYIYNITLNIDKSIHTEWLVWIESHITEVLATGRFISAKLTEVLVDDPDGATTYSVQYKVANRQELDDYYQFDADNLRVEGVRKFGEKMLAFRTELRVVKEFYPTSVSN